MDDFHKVEDFHELRVTLVKKVRTYQRLKKAFEQLNKKNQGNLSLSLHKFGKLMKSLSKSKDSHLHQKLFKMCILKHQDNDDDKKKLHLETFSNWLGLKNSEPGTRTPDVQKKGTRTTRKTKTVIL